MKTRCERGHGSKTRIVLKDGGPVEEHTSTAQKCRTKSLLPCLRYGYEPFTSPTDPARFFEITDIGH